MSYFFGDGFDMYTAVGDGVLGYWDASSLNPNSSSLVVGRFAGSRALNMSNSTRLLKTSGVNDAVHHFTLAFMDTNITGTSDGIFITLWDGTTAQCSVNFRNDGAIRFLQGDFSSATQLALWTGAFTANNVWYQFEIEVVIHNTNGSIAIRKLGNPTNDFSLGSLNTRMTANNYANKIQVGAFSVGVQNIDDFLWRSDAATVPWVGDIRCFTRRPVTDVQAQWSRSTATTSVPIVSTIGIANGFSANTAFYSQFMATYSGTINTVTLNSNISGGGGTGHQKVAIFSSVGGAIGTVLAVSNELTNPPLAVNTFTFPSPVHLTVGQTYWFGFNQDASITCNVINASNTVSGIAIVISSSPYASWPTSNPGGTPGNTNLPGTNLIYTPSANADTVGEAQQDAVGTYAYSSVNGQADLYSISSITATPISIVGVTTRGYFQKTDAGTRNATVQLKSVNTTVQGTSLALNTSWNWIARNDLVDPATGMTWTAAGVNNVTIGPVVTA